MMRFGTTLGLALLLTGCLNTALEKNACMSDGDCLNGHVCLSDTCTPQDSVSCDAACANVADRCQETKVDCLGACNAVQPTMSSGVLACVATGRTCDAIGACVGQTGNSGGGGSGSSVFPPSSAGVSTPTGNNPDGNGGGTTVMPPTSSKDPDGGATAGMINSPPSTIEVHVANDDSPFDPMDGMSGQTPQNYIMAVSRFELLRDLEDPSPIVLFDYGDSPMPIPLGPGPSDTLAGTAPITALQPGTYGFGRVTLAWGSFTVDASVHEGDFAVPGNIDVVNALSDTVINGTPTSQGQATITVHAAGMNQTVQEVFPGFGCEAPPCYRGNGIIDTDNHRTTLTFGLGVTITGAEQTAVATMTLFTRDSFRWQDQDMMGYMANVFDVNADASYEPVARFGANGFELTFVAQ